jgi:hypothetical protein
MSALSATHTHEHPHSHEHSVSHEHTHAPEAGTPPQGGPVVVDVGDGVGALIVHTDPAWLGHELHVRRDGETHTTHTGVWEREVGDRQVVVAVFLALDEGVYALLDLDGRPMTPVTIESGRVGELSLV